MYFYNYMLNAKKKNFFGIKIYFFLLIFWYFLEVELKSIPFIYIFLYFIIWLIALKCYFNIFVFESEQSYYMSILFALYHSVLVSVLCIFVM